MVTKTKTSPGETKEKEYELTFLERLLLRNVYPVKKEYSSLILRNKIMEKLIDQAESKSRQILPEWDCSECGRVKPSETAPECPKCKIPMKSPSPSRVHWINKNKNGKLLPDVKTVVLGEMAYHTITKTLKELNEAEELEPIYLTLYEKFVLDGKVPKAEEEAKKE